MDRDGPTPSAELRCQATGVGVELELPPMFTHDRFSAIQRARSSSFSSKSSHDTVSQLMGVQPLSELDMGREGRRRGGDGTSSGAERRVRDWD